MSAFRKPGKRGPLFWSKLSIWRHKDVIRGTATDGCQLTPCTFEVLLLINFTVKPTVKPTLVYKCERFTNRLFSTSLEQSSSICVLQQVYPVWPLDGQIEGLDPVNCRLSRGRGRSSPNSACPSVSTEVLIPTPSLLLFPCQFRIFKSSCNYSILPKDSLSAPRTLTFDELELETLFYLCISDVTTAVVISSLEAFDP